MRKILKLQSENRRVGTIYHYTMPERTGFVVLNFPKLRLKRRLKTAFGAGLMSVSFSIFLYSYGPMITMELGAAQDKAVIAEVSQAAASVSESPIHGPFLTEINNEKKDVFELTIPFLNTSSKIFKNVDPFDEKSYELALEEGIAHAQGTALPGENGRVFLFAHSTNSPLNIKKYNAVFYNLEKITVGESIALDYEGKKYVYKVSGKEIVSAGDTSWIEKGNSEELVLQTCYPPGTSWKRLLVVAKPN